MSDQNSIHVMVKIQMSNFLNTHKIYCLNQQLYLLVWKFIRNKWLFYYHGNLWKYTLHQ